MRGMMVAGHFQHSTKGAPLQGTVFAQAYSPPPWEERDHTPWW